MITTPDITENFKEYFLDDYLEERRLKANKSRIGVDAIQDTSNRFLTLCDAVKKSFEAEWEQEQYEDGDKSSILLERQKKAIIGYPSEVNYFKSRISEYLKNNDLLNEMFPSYYISLVDAIFHENWGLAGIAQWMNIKESSSAKIVGDRIYFLIGGKSVLQDQRISPERFEQLRMALLLKTPKKRLNESYYEIYMLSGERIAIYAGDIVKENQAAMVFRKYVVQRYTFEEQARLQTIPEAAIPMLKAMVRCGYNVFISGAVRSGKTTFLTTWQSYEDKTLEGVSVETDPEVPFHLIMPEAPILQIVADDDDLIEVSKRILRSDADYIIMVEARDGYAYNLVVETANKGTRRCKTSCHISFVDDICYDVANKIAQVMGGKLNYHIAKVAKSFNYVFHFIQLKNRAKKRLAGIYEIRYDNGEHKITIHQIMKYNFISDDWSFSYDMGLDKKAIGLEEDSEAFKIFDSELKRLSELYPMDGNNVITPLYSKVGDL